MSLRREQAIWDALADANAAWAVRTRPEHIDALAGPAFFASGAEEVERVLAYLVEHFGPLPAGEALDFGCGLGRLSRALASRYDRVLGLDVSPAMIARARSLNEHVEHCSFAVNATRDLRQLADSRFALVLSLIALQHVSPPRAIRSYIREFVRVAQPGGLIVFQLPTRVAWRIRLHPRTLAARAEQLLGRPPARIVARYGGRAMALSGLPERVVRARLAPAELLAVVPDRRTGSDAAPSVTYVARAPRAARPGAASP